MILRVVSMNEDLTEYFEEDIGRDEMENAFLEFQNGENRILIGYADGSKTVINADYVQAMHLEADEESGY